MLVPTRTRWQRQLVRAAILMPLLFATDVRAGSFSVAACGGGPNLTWSPSATHGGMAIYPAPVGCDGGLVARHVAQPAGWTVPGGAAARWFFSAPAGAVIVGATLSGRLDTKDGRWQAALSNGSQIISGCVG